LRGLGLLLRGGGEFVLFFAGELVLLDDVFGGDTHVVVVEHVPQTVVDHAVLHRPIAHLGADAGFGEHVRRQAHVLLATGDDHLGVAGQDGLCGKVNGLQAAAADLVDGHAGNGVGQARAQCRLACGVHADPRGQYVTDDNFVDVPGLDPSLLEQMGNHFGA